MHAQEKSAMTEQETQALVENQRTYFRSNATLSVEFRLEQLRKLRDLLRSHEEELYAAIDKDFGKSKHHTQLTELFPLFEEIGRAHV